MDELPQLHAKLGMPVQLIWGADDPTFPIRYVREMVKQLPKGSLVEIPGAKLAGARRKAGRGAEKAALDFFG